MTMRFPILRRFVAVLAAVAFLASLQMAVMPGAIASPVPAGTEIANQAKPGNCDACGQQLMTAGQCVAICRSIPLLTGLMMSPPSFSAKDSWTWMAEALSTASVEPALSPPRL